MTTGLPSQSSISQMMTPSWRNLSMNHSTTTRAMTRVMMTTRSFHASANVSPPWTTSTALIWKNSTKAREEEAQLTLNKFLINQVKKSTLSLHWDRSFRTSRARLSIASSSNIKLLHRNSHAGQVTIHSCPITNQIFLKCVRTCSLHQESNVIAKNWNCSKVFSSK